MGDSFWSNWIVAKKRAPLLGRKVSQHRVTTWTSKASQSFLIRLPSLCFELGAESFFVFSGFENPCLGNLENTTNSCTNATYQNKPILFQGVPARDVRIWLYIYLLHSWYIFTTITIYYIYTPLTPCHLLGFRPAFASARCTIFWLLTHQLFYHQEFNIIVWQLWSTFYVRLLHMTSSNKANFQLKTPISHRIVGVNNTSAVRTIWVTAYTANFNSNWSYLWFWNHTPETSPGVVLSQTWHPMNLLQKTTETASTAPNRVFWIIEPPNPEERNVTGWKQMGQFLVLGNAIDDSPQILEMQLGHVWICPCMFQTIILRWFSTDF